MQTQEKRIVAIDVSKSTLVAFWPGLSKARSFSNSPSGIKKLIEQIERIQPDITVLENTGGYELGMCDQLWANNIALSRVNPGRIRHFCLASGYLAKTDPIDAKAIYEYAMVMEIKAEKAPTTELRSMRQLFLRRQQLKRNIAKEKNHLSAPGTDKATRSSIKRHIKYLDKEVKAIDCLVKKQINSVPEVKLVADTLHNEKFVGPVLTAALITLLPEIGTLNRRTVAALIGIAPYNKDSGQSERKRCIKGGRGDLRSVLYMATLSAIRRNGSIREYFRRLLARGKHKMVALVACMRKFLIHLNTVVRKAMMLCAAQTQVA